MAAKKTAARKPKRTLGDFPLGSEHYFYYPDVLTDFAHTGGANEQEQEAVLSVQRLLGVPETGRFDSVTANEVARWRAEHDLPHAPLLDEEAWNKMASSA